MININATKIFHCSKIIGKNQSPSFKGTNMAHCKGIYPYKLWIDNPEGWDWYQQPVKGSRPVYCGRPELPGSLVKVLYRYGVGSINGYP